MTLPQQHSLPRKRGRVRVGVLRPRRTDMRGGSAIKVRARRLRGNLTDAEQLLWRELRRGQLGWRFRRQFPIPPYVADFVCIEARLIIEADGGQHARLGDHDRRDSRLRRQGWRILRLWNNDIFENRAGVLQAISDALGSSPGAIPPPLPSPAYGGGGFSGDRRRAIPSPASGED